MLKDLKQVSEVKSFSPRARGAGASATRNRTNRAWELNMASEISGRYHTFRPSRGLALSPGKTDTFFILCHKGRNDSVDEQWHGEQRTDLFPWRASIQCIGLWHLYFSVTSCHMLRKAWSSTGTQHTLPVLRDCCGHKVLDQWGGGGRGRGLHSKFRTEEAPPRGSAHGQLSHTWHTVQTHRTVPLQSQEDTSKTEECHKHIRSFIHFQYYTEEYPLHYWYSRTIRTYPVTEPGADPEVNTSGSNAISSHSAQTKKSLRQSLHAMSKPWISRSTSAN